MRWIRNLRIWLVLACDKTSNRDGYLRKIEEIMSKQIALRLTFARKVVVVIAGVGALAMPGIVGIIDALAIQPQSPQAAARSAQATTPRFEVASVKPCKVEDDTGRGGKGGGEGRIRWDPGRLDEECQTVFNLIRDAYLAYPDGKPWRTAALGDAGLNEPGQVACTGCGGGLPPVSDRQFGQTIKGSPAWLRSDRYVPTSLPSREHPMAAGSRVACGEPSASASGLDFNGTTIANLCRLLSGWADRDVINKTGLAGMFDFHFDIPPRETSEDGVSGQSAPGAPRPADNSAAMFTAAMQVLGKLGLKIAPAKGLGQFLVIDHVERLAGN
jgi:hypothetical protein